MNYEQADNNEGKGKGDTELTNYEGLVDEMSSMVDEMSCLVDEMNAKGKSMGKDDESREFNETMRARLTTMRASMGKADDNEGGQDKRVQRTRRAWTSEFKDEEGKTLGKKGKDDELEDSWQERQDSCRTSAFKEALAKYAREECLGRQEQDEEGKSKDDELKSKDDELKSKEANCPDCPLCRERLRVTTARASAADDPTAVPVTAGGYVDVLGSDSDAETQDW
jgi:hypothetical protein